MPIFSKIKNLLSYSNHWFAKRVLAFSSARLLRFCFCFVFLGLTGSKIVEIRQHGLDKGRAYDFVEDERGPFDFVLATGDDRTDEDLFERLSEDAFSIHVGSGGSLATSSLSSPASVRRLLNLLIASKSIRQL